MQKHRSKGIAVSGLQGAAIAIVVLVVIVAVGAQILGQLRDTQTADTVEFNTTTLGLDAMAEFGNWFVIIVLVVIAVVIITLLLRGFGGLGGA